MDSRRFVNEEIEVNQYTLKMHLTILDLQEDDFTRYSCTAKNSLGEVKGKIKLYGESWGGCDGAVLLGVLLWRW